MDNTKLNELLLTVQRPGRYVGGEWNAVRKEWTDDNVKVVLAFPDNYEVGMSYLGTKIIYGILNAREDCLCERVFSPWPDFEKVLRDNSLPLFSLESRKPLKDFDIIGISLTYELGYTNALNLLDLGGVPVRSSERSDSDPIVIAGGPSCCNPEPMAEFIDAFVIGDGEDAVGEIIEAYKQYGRQKRIEILKSLSRIPGVYVPSFYSVEYNEDGTIKNFRSTVEGVPAVIKKRIVQDLDAAFYPVDQIVPNIQIVHDRIAIEIMRGCKHACAFCQASSIYRPWRERSADVILSLAKKAYDSTGYDEISCLSLSSVDHSHIKEIIECMNAEFGPKAVSISVPSLRIEDAARDIPFLVSKVKKSGLTFAPEAGSERLRHVINKRIDISKLFLALDESFRSGWRAVKLYFMTGLPTETEQDLGEIIDMLYKVSDSKRKFDGRNAQVKASVNVFVPKPHTPFQWHQMDSRESTVKKRDYLRHSMKSRHIELDFHSLDMGYLEAVFARGDRRIGKAIYDAWSSGARFDGWQEHFKFERWKGAFEASGIDPDFYVTRPRLADEILPWDHIDIGIDRASLLKIKEKLATP